MLPGTREIDPGDDDVVGLAADVGGEAVSAGAGGWTGLGRGGARWSAGARVALSRVSGATGGARRLRALNTSGVSSAASPVAKGMAMKGMAELTGRPSMAIG